MKFTYDNEIIENPLHFFYKEVIFELPKRLGWGDYATSFNVLKNWNLARTFAINKCKLTSDYINLLEHGQFDEN